MKVYQINVVCGNGSTGRIAADLSRAIHKNGGKCRIGYGRGDSPEDIDSFKDQILFICITFMDTF